MLGDVLILPLGLAQTVQAGVNGTDADRVFQPFWGPPRPFCATVTSSFLHSFLPDWSPMGLGSVLRLFACFLHQLARATSERASLWPDHAL